MPETVFNDTKQISVFFYATLLLFVTFAQVVV